MRQTLVIEHLMRGLIVSIAVLTVSCSSSREWNFDAAFWPEADQLFQNDPFWVGGDDAYSIPLDRNQTLWLFADTVIDTSGRHSRHTARMIRNSLAIQDGSDPSSADISFFWNRDSLGQPSSFFPENDGDWFWPGHGLRLDDRLILFLMRVRGIPTGIGFEVYDWEAVLIPNPDDRPSDWDVRWLDVPGNDFQVIIGSASVFEMKGHIYAFGAREGHFDHPVYVVRWPKGDVLDGNLADIEWWVQSSGTWVPQPELGGLLEPVFQNGQTEFTVHFEKRMDRYLCVQSVDFGASNIYCRTAKFFTGPWTDPVNIFEPPEKSKPNIMIYAAKAHPQLIGADVVLTYATNSFEFSDLASDTTIYYPRFVRLDVVDSRQ